MNVYVVVVHVLGSLAVFSAVLALALLAALAVGPSRAWVRREFAAQPRPLLVFAALVALVATSGSLYFSAGAGFVPCELCWFQRIFMYPLVLVLGVAAWRSDPAGWRYGLPLAAVGLAISTYHVLLQFNPSLELTTCDAGVPCSMRYVAVFGFVSIPVMAGSAFALIGALLLTVRSGSPEVRP